MELVRGQTISESAWQRLAIFFLASICLHGGLLLTLKLSAPSISDRMAATLSVDLVLIDPPATKPVNRAPPVEKRRRKRSASPPAKIAHAPPVERAPATQPQREIESIEPSSPPLSAPESAPPTLATAPALTTEDVAKADQVNARRASIEAKVQARLLTDLARHFEYPSLARRRGWQGMVLLSVMLKPDGVLEHVRVSQSSGYDVLDRSAMDTMRRVGHIAEAKHWLNGQGLELLLPIVYRLTD